MAAGRITQPGGLWVGNLAEGIFQKFLVQMQQYTSRAHLRIYGTSFLEYILTHWLPAI